MPSRIIPLVVLGRGLAVTIAPALIADVFDDLAVRPIAGPAPRRDVHALLPPGRRHPLVAPALAALASTASLMNRSERSRRS